MLLPVLSALLLAQPAAAQARLTFSSDSPACREDALVRAVASRLGYDPFAARVEAGVEVNVIGDSTLRATLTVPRPGLAPASRVLSGPADCAALTEALAGALAAHFSGAAPGAERPPVAQAAAPPPAELPPARVVAGIAAGADIGQQPDGLVSARLGARVGGGRVSGLLELVLTLPSRLRLSGGGSIEGQFVGGDAGVCLGASVFVGCALLRAGAMRYGGADLDMASQGWLPSLSGGVRAAVEWPRNSLVAVQASLELRVPITRLSLYVGEQLAWQQNWVIGALQAGLVVRLPGRI